MIAFLLPVFFIALSGLLIPLIIHLWNRKKGKEIAIGSIELLREAAESKVSNITFTEFWLFLLRAAIVVLFSLLLTKPLWKDHVSATPSQTWALIDPRIQDTSFIQTLTSNLSQQDIPTKTLSTGFPDYNSQHIHSHPISAILNTWSLLHELSLLAQAPDSLHIYSYAFVNDLKGKRPDTPFEIDWVHVPLRAQHIEVVEAVAANEQLHILVHQTEEPYNKWSRINISSNTDSLTLTVDTLNEIALRYLPEQNMLINEYNVTDITMVYPPDTVSFKIYFEESFKEEITYFEAAISAINTYVPHHIALSIQESVDSVIEDADLICWLAEEQSPPDHIFQNGTIIYYEPKEYSPDLITRNYQYQDTYILTQILSDYQINDENFIPLPNLLMEIIWGDKYELMAQQTVDYAQYTIDHVKPRYKPATDSSLRRSNVSETSLHFYIWILITILFIMERVVSIRFSKS